MVKIVVVVVSRQNIFLLWILWVIRLTNSETARFRKRNDRYTRQAALLQPTHDLSSPADAKQPCFLYCLLMSTAAGWCIWNRPSPSWTHSNWSTMPHWASTHQGSRSIPSFNGLNWPTCGTHRLYTRDTQVPASQHTICFVPPASQHHLHL